MEVLVEFLRRYHVGKQAAVTAAELTASGWGSARNIRREVHRARKSGFPICSSGKGYFYPSTPHEKKLCRKRLTNMGKGILSVTKVLKPVDNRQMSLFELA